MDQREEAKQQEDARKAEEHKREEATRDEARKVEEKRREEEKKAEERKQEDQRRDEQKREEKREEKRERKPYVFEEEQQQIRQGQPSRAKPAKQQQDRGGPRQGDDELQQALSMDHPALSDAQKSVLVHQGYKSHPDFDKREAERKASAKTDHAKPAARQTYEFANEKDQGRPDMQR